MHKKTTYSGLRAGIAKDKLIFIIICSAAIGVAVVTLAVTQFSGGRAGRIKSQWQCLEHGHEFSSKTTEMPPIECTKCGTEAVKLISRKCPQCGEKNLIARMRLTKAGQDQLKAMADQQGAGPPMPMMGPMGLDMEIQLWYKQEDGSYTWSDWMPMNQMYRGQVCSKCGASLYGRR